MSLLRKLLLGLITLFLYGSVNAQNIISGKIISGESQSPLPGVTIMVKGTSNGTVSDNNGRFSIKAPRDATLIFSFISFKTVEIPINGRTQINVTLQRSENSLNSLVVIGYGTQKKVDLTGSVSSVSGRELIKSPVSDPVDLLEGQVAGLKISQSYGKPGDPGNTIQIRGLGTFSSAGSTPLVLIDGVPGDMSTLDPNSIESISILKDAAAAAIYGSRGANGVILVTTKTGKPGPLTIEYDGNIQFQSATRLPKLLYNSAEYMEYWNEGRIREGLQPYFSQADIDAFKDHPNDPVHYPNFNWEKFMFHTGFAQNHHLGVSGGDKKTNFRLDLGYLNQGGIISIYGFQKYNLHFSINSQVKKWITIGGEVNMNRQDITESYINSSNGDYLLGVFAQGPNYTPTMKLADGQTVYVARYSSEIGEYTARNPFEADAVGFNKTQDYTFVPQVYVDIRFNKHLNWYTKGAFTYGNTFNKLREHPEDTYYFKDSSYADNNFPVHEGVTDNSTENTLTSLFSTLHYDNTFKSEHHLSVLLGYDLESNFYRQLGAHRTSFPSDNLNEINAGSTDGQTTSGTANAWSLLSYFGRVNYDFKGKYLFEANMRYDGTSRIAPQGRWGLFPSLSAGWRISEESFMKNLNWLSNLKIRGSWGQLGNQNVGLYPYQDILSITSYPFNNLDPGVQLTRLVDKSLKWETTTMTDFGVDVDILDGLLTATFDWYNKLTSGILYQAPIPASVGLSAPTINYGKMRNRGWEFEVSHQNTIGQFHYGVSVNFSTNKNKVLQVVAPSIGSSTITKAGIPFNSFYLIKWIGIFQSQEEINKSPTQQYTPQPGDLKFADINGDGVVDSKDRVVVPGAYPKFYYGGTLSLGWKGLDISAFFQGVQGQYFYFNGGGWGFSPYVQGSPPTIDFVKNMWTPTNHTNKYPAMYITGYPPVSGVQSTYWLKNASYLRLKNLIISYNLPGNIIKKIGFGPTSIYISGNNILTVTKYPGSDPERSTQGGRYSAYPQIKTYTFGVRLTL